MAHGEHNIYLTTLDALKRHMRASTDPTYDAADDTALAEFIQQASQEIVDMILDRLPLPHLKTETLRRAYVQNNLFREHYEWRLRVPDDLLSITSITWIDDSLTSSEYRLANENRNPNDEIAVDSDALSTVYPADFDESVSIVGIWGYVPQWATAWTDSTDTVSDNPLSASETTLKVTTSGGNFEEYQYIRIESEYMLITAIDTTPTPDELTVERGVLGTTAASHVQTTQIDIFSQHGTIQRGATEYAAYLEKTKNNLGEQVAVYDGVTVVNKGLSKRLLASLRSHRRLVFRTA